MRGLFFATTLPLWEGFDEPAHFGVIDFVARNHAWPTERVALPVAVKDSLALLPLASALAEPGQMTHDDYWRLPEPRRRELQDRFSHLTDVSDTQRARAGREMYEAQQAPVYYLLMAIPYQWMMSWQLADRVMGIRLLTLWLASLVIPETFVIARRPRGVRISGIAGVYARATTSCSDWTGYWGSHVDQGLLADRVACGCRVLLCFLEVGPSRGVA